MKLYYSKGACSLAIRILINELQLKCDYIAVDLKTKRMENGEDFLTINHKGSVPALKTDHGDILTEGAVIQQYLADKTHAIKLLPPVNEMARYHVLEWLNFVATDLHKSCGPLFSPNLDQQVKNDVFIPYLKSKLKIVDEQLAKEKFLVMDHLTLPDGYLFVILRWVAYAFKFDLNEWPNMKRYFADLANYPAIKQSLAQEGL